MRLTGSVRFLLVAYLIMYLVAGFAVALLAWIYFINASTVLQKLYSSFPNLLAHVVFYLVGIAILTLLIPIGVVVVEILKDIKEAET